MSSGLKIPECHYCWDLETMNPPQISDRARLSASEWALPHLSRVAQLKPDEDITPTYLEVSFSSICNFKCSYCDPTKSTKWLEEIEKHGPYPTSWMHNNLEQYRKRGSIPIPLSEPNPYRDAFWRWWPELYPSLHTFRVTGGEPTLSQDLWRVLEWIDQHPHRELELSINTNLGAPRALIDRLGETVGALVREKKIRTFILHTSIDAAGPPAEYIRHGLHERTYWENVERLIERLEGSKIIFMSAFNILSITSYERLLDRILDLKERSPGQVIIDINHVSWPYHQSLQILPRDLQERVERALEYMESFPYLHGSKRWFYEFEVIKLRRLTEWMRQPMPEDRLLQFRRDFHRFFSEHDRRRGTDFKGVFPELVPFYDSCGTL